MPAPADPNRMRRALAILAVTALAGCGAAAESEAPAKRVVVAQEGPAEMAPLPTARPQLVQPVAGEANGDAAATTQTAGTAPADDSSLPKPTGPASGSLPRDVGDANATDLDAGTATALSNGIALPPLEAPEAVLNVIRAGNIIARSPYKWGGGHGRFQDNGYDCSGSVSYALYYAGLIDGPHVSGDLMAYGRPGPGRWITILASPTHVYMEVAGIRFDTSGQSVTGSRWQNDLRDNSGMEVRHPPGL